MIWGLTKAEKRARQMAERSRIEEWHKWFAWIPVRLLDGRVAWIQNIERKSMLKIIAFGSDNRYQYAIWEYREFKNQQDV